MSFRRPFLRASLAALQISLDCCDAAPDHVAFGQNELDSRRRLLFAPARQRGNSYSERLLGARLSDNLTGDKDASQPVFGPFAAKVLLVEALDELRRSFHFDRTP